MKTYSVFFSVFLMLIARQSFAGSVEVAQWIPWSFISSEVKKIPLSFHSAQDTFQMNFQEWTPKATSLDFQVQGGISDIQLDQNGAQALGTNLSATLHIGQISIDQVVIREIAGNQIQIRVQANCQPFDIRISKFDVTAQAPFLRSNDHWAPQLSAVGLQIPQGSWTVTPISCQGAQGIDQKISNLIQETLSQPASMQYLLKYWLAPQIDQFWKDTWKSLTAEAWQNLKVQSMSEPSAQGFFLYGSLDTKTPAAVALPHDITVPLSATTPQLLFSTDGFAALVQDSVSNFKIENYNLQQIDAFKNFMHNRFLQFFTWPDLLNFSRDIPILYSSLPDQTKTTLQPQSTGTWVLQLQSAGVLRVSRKGQMRNYIDMGVGMSSILTTEVKDSHLTLKSTSSKSNISWKFNSEYVRLFQPSTRISSSLLKTASTALFENRSIEQQLPVLNWKGRLLKLNGWKQQGTTISLDWK